VDAGDWGRDAPVLLAELDQLERDLTDTRTPSQRN
jgi:hypothetical protein